MTKQEQVKRSFQENLSAETQSTYDALTHVVHGVWGKVVPLIIITSMLLAACATRSSAEIPTLMPTLATPPNHTPLAVENVLIYAETPTPMPPIIDYGSENGSLPEPTLMPVMNEAPPTLSPAERDTAIVEGMSTIVTECGTNRYEISVYGNLGVLYGDGGNGTVYIDMASLGLSVEKLGIRYDSKGSLLMTDSGAAVVESNMSEYGMGYVIDAPMTPVNLFVWVEPLDSPKENRSGQNTVTYDCPDATVTLTSTGDLPYYGCVWNPSYPSSAFWFFPNGGESATFLVKDGQLFLFDDMWGLIAQPGLSNTEAGVTVTVNPK